MVFSKDFFLRYNTTTCSAKRAQISCVLDLDMIGVIVGLLKEQHVGRLFVEMLTEMLFLSATFYNNVRSNDIGKHFWRCLPLERSRSLFIASVITCVVELHPFLLN